MNEKINEALEQIPDKFIQEAETYKKRHFPRYLGAIAAVLALVILIGALKPWVGSSLTPTGTTGPQPGTTPGINPYLSLLSAPVYPEMVPYSDENWTEWRESIRNQYDQPEGYADDLNAFFLRSIPEFLSAAEGENAICSPVNIYMALAMLAECTEGNSRQQILELLGADSITALRQQAGHVWNAHYRDDGIAKLLLGNSLWLDEAWNFRQDTVDILADSYYASVFRGDLGTDAINKDLQAWINEQTGGLLEEQAGNIELDPQTVLALASTIHYQVNWDGKFSKKNNTEGTFYSSKGDSAATFMNQSYAGSYYVGDGFTAVAKALEDGSNMWLILPDMGTTAEQLLSDGRALSLAMWLDTNITVSHPIINLSLPKFDVVSDADLVKSMHNLGVTDIFKVGVANLDGIHQDSPRNVYISSISHAARVAIDEDGVVAAAFTMIAEAGTGLPEDVVDFVVDRPFVFVITSPDGLPLFTGVVNEV